MLGTTLAERGLLPDTLVRWGIRRMVRERLEEIRQPDEQARSEADRAWAARLRHSPVALVPELANEQHYEVDADFFRLTLGPRLKYSCALFPKGVRDLATAEERMLELTCRRADLQDGMRILDLGCGWGSTALYAAEHYPQASIVAVSNSKLQREFILGRARERGLGNVQVLTADINAFAPEGRFDRVVSVEMFEHVRNYAELMQRIASWLEPAGKLFVHLFAHRTTAYPYEDRGAGDWMARHFFSGGQMPSHDLLLRFQDDLELEKRWRVSGNHYRRTAAAWLDRLDANREGVLQSLGRTYGREEARLWLRRWRLFYMGCEELFGFANGAEWGVSHYLFGRADVG
jgi:cyclopropane-fatty-acyl-phospholipid synthase